MYAAKGKIGLICKKFQKSDVKLLLILLVLEIVVSLSLIVLLDFLLGSSSQANPAFDSIHNIKFWITFPLQIFNEELIKIIGFIIVLFLVNKLTNNRKLGVIIATIISLSIFGFLHYPAYKDIVHSVIAIGLGSIVTMYAYLKTKNILASYVIHISYDILMFASVIIFSTL